MCFLDFPPSLRTMTAPVSAATAPGVGISVILAHRWLLSVTRNGMSTP